MVTNNYFIVTPCKNEIANLPNLIDSVVNQSVTPSLWVIYNDGSTDGSSELLTELENKYDWINIINGEVTRRDLSFHYARIVDETLKTAIDKCTTKGIDCQYASLIDADMVLEKTFFEKLLSYFEQDPELGVASGSVVYDFNDLSTLEKGRNDLPIGGLRMWRVECLVQSNFFPISYSADAVSNVLATLKGWNTRKFDDVLGLQTRRTSSAEGMWKGYMIKGESDYFRDYHLLYVILKFMKYCLSYPFYIGLSYSYGYFKSVLERRNKIDLPEVRRYYRNKHKEIISYYLKND
ncbi:glycosyltransferase family 2 protein [Methanolobus bombayensis]|uniref:glycosyltransferase family 2 protein n=1 Tax=Methanolobus bombayensis TaxID=38023 RepID=UPI001AE68995|nr:glycosyltransferase [Methanolobus bombayensis]MBP1910290.1 glycosyltransferase involved in cell wall biosynthesis [Methanolobus bombayensis]